MEDAEQLVRPATISIGERESFMGIAVCALGSGREPADERKALPSHLARLRMYAGMTSEELDFTLARVARIGHEAGLDRLLSASARAVPERLRDSAFAFAVDVILAHRDLGIEEQVFLERLRHRIGVDVAQATLIQNVARIRNMA